MIIVMMMADAALFFNQDLQPSTASYLRGVLLLLTQRWREER